MTDEEQEISEWLGDGERKVQIRAQLQEGLWYLDILDKDNNRTLWEDGFSNQQEALAEGRAAVEEAGVDYFIGDPDELGAGA